MTDSNIYFGNPGSLVTLPQPRGGVKTTRVRGAQVSQLGNGEVRTRRILQGSRQFTLSYETLTFDTHSTLLAFDQGHYGPGPYAFLDPGERNMLTVNQSGATSLTNGTENFTIAGSGCSIASSTTLTTGTPRSLAWTFNFTSPASASAVLTLDTPYQGWPGIPVVSSRSLCFACQLRGGGTDAVVSFALELQWYDITQALLSTSTGSTATTSSGAWTTASVAATPPANSVYVLPRVHYVSGASAGSIIYLTQFMLAENTTTETWRPGTGVYPVGILSYVDDWPWQYSTEVRSGPVLVLQQDGR